MKKLFLFLVPFLFIGCMKTICVDSSTSNPDMVTSTIDSELLISSFMDLKLVYRVDNPYNVTDSSDIGAYGICIYVDKNTDVLYVRETACNRASMTPIMKADGTCLTYSEWRNENDM